MKSEILRDIEQGLTFKSLIIRSSRKHLWGNRRLLHIERPERRWDFNFRKISSKECLIERV